ncbi:hypothetical protein EMCRGX_G030943 [Ephydatia muelleri]
MATVLGRWCSNFLLPLTLIRRFSSAAPIALDQELLNVLVCPLSKEPLRYDESANKLVNDKLGVVYSIIEGVPNLVPESAKLRKPSAENESGPQTIK